VALLGSVRLGGGRRFAATLVLLVVSAHGCADNGGGDGPGPTPGPMPEVGGITFSPPVIRLDNPTSPGQTKAAVGFTVDVKAYDTAGQVVTPSVENPLTVRVHGAPTGTIVPVEAVLTSGSSVAFTYDGSYFANPITLTAWIAHPRSSAARVAGAGSGATRSLGRTQIAHRNPIDCTYGTASYAVPLVQGTAGDAEPCDESATSDALRIRAAVGGGADVGAFCAFTIDTGSLGVVVPATDLGPEAVGPGAPGVKFYDSSGNTYAGNYYLAPVSFALADGTSVTTPPIKVLGITSAYCAPGYSECPKDPPSPTLRYLGIGFDRNATAADDGFDSPADNPFLQLANGADVGDVSPGYVLTGDGDVTLGITSTSGYATVPLTPSTTVPGDWNGATGCYGFPGLSDPVHFCGSFLLDVGIKSMFLDLKPSERPPGTFTDDCPAGHAPCVPATTTTLQVIAGDPSSPAMSYEVTLSNDVDGAAPTFAQWIDSSQTFVNTGRYPLSLYDYLFDARCGNVGFKPAD
jgi:hypothetical protein